MDKVKIPVPFTLEMDDVGWDNGSDLRLSGRASRSGLPRYHAREDYELLSRLGERTGKNLVVALCLGDWDKDNLLRGEVGITHDPYGWDRASEIDVAKFEGYRDILENSEHIEYIVHGILHGVYDENGKMLGEIEFRKFEVLPNGKKRYYIDDYDFEHRMDLFYRIYESWGFKKPLLGFVFPCGIYSDDEEFIKDVARRLYKRGIRYWVDDFNNVFKESVRIYEGVACFNWIGGGGRLPWNAYDCDPSELGNHVDPTRKITCFRGNHWTNFLRFNPKNNFEQIEPWAKYYESQSEVFGTILANSAMESVNQIIHYEYTDVNEGDGVITLDFSRVTELCYSETKKTCFISLEKGTKPLAVSGASASLYEEHSAFDTYRLDYTSDRVEIKI